MRASTLVAALLGCWLTQAATGQSIKFDKRDATVWSQEQVVSGTSEVSQGVLRVGDERLLFDASDGTFSVPVWLREGTTSIKACTPDEAACPDTLRLTLAYELRPEAELVASVSGRAVTLTGTVLANPDSAALSFEWKEDPTNPAPVALSETSESTAAFVLPEDVPAGEYYFDWLVLSDDTVRARTFVTVDSTGVVPFDIQHDHAVWVDAAVIYGVTPYNLEDPGNLDNVVRRLPEMAALGVNTLWILPIYSTADMYGPGYWVTDYFQVRSDYGTKEDLRVLVETAHSLGMKVLLDFVPNHTHLDHPYAQHAIAYGDSSHYYDFYQRLRDDVRYNEHYNTRTLGKMTFIYYFWPELPNLNYDNPEVQRYITEAARYWIEEFGIDGYRIDAVWGARARNPEFFQEWRRALKRVKPEVLLLGEDKATDPSSFDFWDAAYDWYNGNVWISEWAWQPGGHTSPTIFTAANVNGRSGMLRDALTNKGQGWHPDAKVLRFMENNDTQRFIVQHGLERTKMAAALLFSLPGIPLVFNGQEVGERAQPYEDDSYYLLDRGKPITGHAGASVLYPYYQHLIDLRNSFPALYSDQFAEVPVQPEDARGYVYAYHRWEGEQHILGVVNMADDSASVTLGVPVDELEFDDATTYYLNDLIAGEAITTTGAEMAAVSITLPPYTTRLFALADSVMNIGLPTPVEEPDALPVQVALEQNFPNPFSPTTTIAFLLPNPGPVRLVVFDLLGREVATLVDGTLNAGRHSVGFDGNGLASGLYLYRIDFGGQQHVRRMTLVK